MKYFNIQAEERNETSGNGEESKQCNCTTSFETSIYEGCVGKYTFSIFLYVSDFGGGGGGGGGEF